MANHIVIYETKYGSTRQYARWIAQALDCDFFTRRGAEVNELYAFDTIIYGGPIYGGGVSGIKLIRNNFESLRGKHLIVFTCGLSDPANPENVTRIRERLGRTLTPDILGHLKLFHLRGAIDYDKLNLMHRAMMGMVIRPIRKKDPASLNAEEQHMLDTYGKAVSFLERSAIDPLIDYARSL